MIKALIFFCCGPRHARRRFHAGLPGTVRPGSLPVMKFGPGTVFVPFYVPPSTGMGSLGPRPRSIGHTPGMVAIPRFFKLLTRFGLVTLGVAVDFLRKSLSVRNPSDALITAGKLNA